LEAGRVLPDGKHSNLPDKLAAFYPRYSALLSHPSHSIRFSANELEDEQNGKVQEETSSAI
jgi:hypothetical protein